MAGDGPKHITIAPSAPEPATGPDAPAEAAAETQRAIASDPSGLFTQVIEQPAEGTPVEEVVAVAEGLSVLQVTVTGCAIALFIICLAWFRASQRAAVDGAFALSRDASTVNGVNMRRARHDAIDFRQIRQDRMTTSG
ncbi:hypothetical protein [Pontivivens insulae]|uniref:Uncharacterized protein n=1 Tax=Pontivivens insulae TaxID=1639689 RepID=A0A2R8ABH3_9RHOB|nr:hypothetical protein [Pontivivens insulae]RED13336.1 hypothetical protein DFR53_2473 [Pontivivens insulae]SPF29428.1 hypothetical protein POI8812_01738 [Pontivivens insulae]